jgi:hypothetical protein
MTDVLKLLERCSDLERSAAAVYEVFARRFTSDAELAALWASLARDEHDHAHQLDAFHEPLVSVGPERRPPVTDLDEDLADVHWLLAESRNAAASVDEEEAFAIALAIETSELDAISAAVLQVAALTVGPHGGDPTLHDSAGHHEKLLAMAKRRCQADTTMRRAALLAAAVSRRGRRGQARAAAPQTWPPTPRARRTPSTAE